MKPKKIEFDEKAPNCVDVVRYAVRYDAEEVGHELRLESENDVVGFPLAKIDWLIDRLTYIRREVTTNSN